MSWFDIVLVCLFGLSAVCSILMTGKRRAPLTAGEVLFIVLIDAALILGVITQGG